jgi:hypothetical protein
MQSISVIPAYGRDYKSKQAVIDAWNAGNDFNSGRGYINKTEAEAGEFTHVQFHYANRMKTFILPLR